MGTKISEKIKPFTGALLVFSGAVLFSGKAVFVKMGFQYGASVMTLLNLRMLFSFPFFLLMAFFSGKSHKEKVTRNEWFLIIFLGVIGYYLASFFDFQGLKYISTGLERLIVFVYPTLVVVISALVFRTSIGKKEIIALLLTYIGIAVAFQGENTGIQKDVLTGAFLVFCSALTYAIYLIGSGKLIPKIGAARYTAYAMMVSTVAVLLHSVVTNDLDLVVKPEVYIISLFMAVFCTVIPAILLAEGIKRIGSSTASIIAGIGPVSTIILASMFLNEQITALQIAGTAMVILGVLMVSKKEEKPKVQVLQVDTQDQS